MKTEAAQRAVDLAALQHDGRADVRADGKWKVFQQCSRSRQGRSIAILAFGTLLYPAMDAGQALGATVANMRWAKPLDLDLLRQIAGSHDAIVTVEEGCLPGGAGGAVAEALNAEGLVLPVLHLGLPDVFIEHGDPARLLAGVGLDAAGIEASIRQRFGHLIEGAAGLKVVR